MFVKACNKEKSNYNTKIMRFFDYRVIYKLIYNSTFSYKIINKFCKE